MYNITINYDVSQGLLFIIDEVLGTGCWYHFHEPGYIRCEIRAAMGLHAGYKVLATQESRIVCSIFGD